MAYLLCDLSEHQREVDFGRLRSGGIAGVYLRASYGRTGIDATIDRKTRAARAAGLRVGFYHYAYPHRNRAPLGEADNFARVVRSVGGIGRRDLRPMLDVEDTPAEPFLSDWSRDWNREVVRRLGVGPLFYSYGPFVAAMRPATPIGYGLVLAAYGRNDGRDYPVEAPAPWRAFVAHQFTSRGRLPGVVGDVDLWHAPRLRPLLARPFTGLV